MTKNTALKILNPVLGLLLINQAVTGVFADNVYAFSPKAFEILHEGGGYCLVALSLLHVILNWNWIKVNFFRKKPPVHASTGP